MSGHHGDEAKDEAAEEIEHHVEILLILHQRWAFVHEGGEGGEATAEACGEQQLGGGIHPSAAIPRNAGEKSDDEAAQHVYCHGAEGESYEAARLHHLGNPISQAASKEAAYAYD